MYKGNTSNIRVLLYPLLLDKRFYFEWVIKNLKEQHDMRTFIE